MLQAASGGVEARERADAGVVADFLALRVEQRVGDDSLVPDAWAFLAEVELHVVERQGEVDRL